MDLYVLAGEKANVIDDEQVARVRHGYMKRIALKAEGNGLVFLHDIEGNKAQDFLWRVKPGYIHLRAMELLGYKLQKSIFIYHAELYQGRPDAFSGMALLVKGAVELLDGDESFLDQQFAYLFSQSSILPKELNGTVTGPAPVLLPESRRRDPPLQ
jgi:hypothetical protein